MFHMFLQRFHLFYTCRANILKRKYLGHKLFFLHVEQFLADDRHLQVNPHSMHLSVSPHEFLFATFACDLGFAGRPNDNLTNTKPNTLNTPNTLTTIDYPLCLYVVSQHTKPGAARARFTKILDGERIGSKHSHSCHGPCRLGNVQL